MLRTLIAAATLLGLPSSLSADDAPERPRAAPLTVLNPGWVKPDGTVAATLVRAVPETRMTARTAIRIIDGMQVVVREEVPYTIMRSVPFAIEVEASEVQDARGIVVSGEALATDLRRSGPVMVSRGRLDAAFRTVLKDNALVLVSPGGVRVSGVAEGPRWLPSVTLASVLERDGEVRLRLSEAEAPRSSEKGRAAAEGNAGEINAAKASEQSALRELTFDGADVQACDLKGERLTARALLRRLKAWTPVLVLKEKPEAAYAQTFKDDTIVILVGGGEPGGAAKPLGRKKPPVRRLDIDE